MIDGQLRRVVMFPDDGHPDLAAYVANLTGDARDEVVLWDQERVWIYTQDRPFSGRADLRAAPQSRLQRVELPHGGLASGLGWAGVAFERPREATMKTPLGGVVTAVLALALSTTSAQSADWYVTPQGRADRAGTAECRGASPPHWVAAARSSRGRRSGSVRARITRPPRSAGTAMRCGSSAGRDTRSGSVPCPMLGRPSTAG